MKPERAVDRQRREQEQRADEQRAERLVAEDLDDLACQPLMDAACIRQRRMLAIPHREQRSHRDQCADPGDDRERQRERRVARSSRWSLGAAEEDAEAQHHGAQRPRHGSAPTPDGDRRPLRIVVAEFSPHGVVGEQEERDRDAKADRQDREPCEHRHRAPTDRQGEDQDQEQHRSGQSDRHERKAAPEP